MRHFDNLPQFYSSKEWEACKAQVLQERAKNGVVYCEHCGQPILKTFNSQANNNKGALVFHHKIYLNALNVNDASISINPENIAVLHWSCHNEVHERFGFGGKPEKKVYLITGAPCSGKSTFARSRMQANDLILDIDDLWEMVSGKPRYTKPSALKPIIFQLRDDYKGMIGRGAGTWRTAYILESLPSPADRQREADKYKAFNVEIVTMDTSEEECLRRLHALPNGRSVKDYEGYIREYFSRYRE